MKTEQASRVPCASWTVETKTEAGMSEREFWQRAFLLYTKTGPLLSPEAVGKRADQALVELRKRQANK